MKQRTISNIESFFCRNPHLAGVRSALTEVIQLLVQTYRSGGKVLICGNGGSAADAEHIAGELMKGFCLKRPVPADFSEALKAAAGEHDGQYLAAHLQSALPAIPLVSHSALMTAFINDVAADTVFAQQVYGYGRKNDVLIALTTSGNSANVVNAALVARAVGMKIVGMTGCSDSRLSTAADITLKSPESETYLVQEDHIKFYHLFCAAVETELFEV